MLAPQASGPYPVRYSGGEACILSQLRLPDSAPFLGSCEGAWPPPLSELQLLTQGCPRIQGSQDSMYVWAAPVPRLHVAVCCQSRGPSGEAHRESPEPGLQRSMAEVWIPRESHSPFPRVRVPSLALCHSHVGSHPVLPLSILRGSSCFLDEPQCVHLDVSVEDPVFIRQSFFSPWEQCILASSTRPYYKTSLFLFLVKAHCCEVELFLPLRNWKCQRLILSASLANRNKSVSNSHSQTYLPWTLNQNWWCKREWNTQNQCKRQTAAELVSIWKFQVQKLQNFWWQNPASRAGILLIHTVMPVPSKIFSMSSLEQFDIIVIVLYVCTYQVTCCVSHIILIDSASTIIEYINTWT